MITQLQALQVTTQAEGRGRSGTLSNIGEYMTKCNLAQNLWRVPLFLPQSPTRIAADDNSLTQQILHERKQILLRRWEDDVHGDDVFS